jgi:hypothetical protein
LRRFWVDEIQVLNGTTKVGDRIGIAVSAGRYGGGMRIGEILEINAVPAKPGGFKRIEVKVRVTHTSGTSWGGLPYTKTFEDPDRMVKL